MRRTIDLKSLLQVLRKNFMLIVVISVMTLTASVLYAKFFVTPMYVSSVKLYINNKAGDTDKVTHSDIVSSQELISTYMVFMNDDEVMQKVAEGMNGRYTLSKVKDMVSFESIGDSTFIKIVATSPSPEDSKALCDLTALNAKSIIETITKIQNIEIYGVATTPSSPAFPRISMYALLGFLTGFAVSYVVLYIRAARDNTIKGKDTILEHFDIPFFGEVPSLSETGKGAKTYGKSGYGY